MNLALIGNVEPMERFLELLVDTDTVLGRGVSTAAVIVIALVVAELGGRAVTRRMEDPTSRYYARKVVRWMVVVLSLIPVAIIWRAFAGRVGVVLGLVTAGIAFAMQEVIGALAGGINILFGRIFSVGDRIEMGGVRGDVIDVTPMRTKVMEIGSADGSSWVKGRQYTGRVVTISNKATFTDPVFNFTTGFEFIWEELLVPVPHEADWRTAEQILQEEVQSISDSAGARDAMRQMVRRYPVPRTEVVPRVFLRSTDNWMELSARFVVPVRTARSMKDELTRRVTSRLEAAGIPIASATMAVTVSSDTAEQQP